MKKSFISFLFVLIIVIGLVNFFDIEEVNASDEKVEVLFFYNNPCETCEEDKKFIELFYETLNENEISQEYEIVAYKSYTQSGSDALMQLYEAYNIEKTMRQVPVVFIGKDYLIEGRDFEKDLGPFIIEATKNYFEDRGIDFVFIDDEKRAEAGYELVDNEEQLAVLFTVSGCESCHDSKDYLESLITKDIDLEIYNIATESNLARIKSYYYEYKVEEEDQKVPILFLGNNYYSGYEAISKLQKYEIFFHSIDTKMLVPNENIEVESNRSIFYAFGTGILNGLNPCSLSMLLFVISLIALSKKKIIQIAMPFIIGKWIAFIIFGTILFNVLVVLDLSFVSMISKIVIGILALGVVSFNIKDIIMIRREQFGKVSMQLPTKLREKNHQLIKKFLNVKSKYIILVAFVLGIIISAGELLCTGQIYLATIIYMVNNHASFNMYVLVSFMLYSLGFITPLMIVTFLIYKGKEMFDISDFFMTNMLWVKVINIVFFTVFGALIIFVL